MLAGTAPDGYSTPKIPARRPPPSTTRGTAVTAATTTTTTTAAAAAIGGAALIGGVVSGTTPRTATAGEMPQRHASNTNHAVESQHGHGVDSALLECELKSRTEDGAARLRRDRTAIKVILAALQPPRSAPGSKFNILALLSPGSERERETSAHTNWYRRRAVFQWLSNHASNANGPMPKLTSSLVDMACLRTPKYRVRFEREFSKSSAMPVVH